MPGKISFGPTACDLFVDAQERKKANEIMPEFTGYHKAIKKVDIINYIEEVKDYYVDYVPNPSMDLVGRFSMGAAIEAVSAKQFIDDATPIHILLKAGTPPSGRTRTQHLLIKNFNNSKNKKNRI